MPAPARVKGARAAGSPAAADPSAFLPPGAPRQGGRKASSVVMAIAAFSER